MIIGHIGPVFGMRRLWPRVPMRVLLIGTFLPDIVRLCLVLAGESTNDANVYSHTLPWSALVAVAGALLAWWITRQREAGWAVLALVPAHVLFDLVSGQKELWVGGPTGIDLDHSYWQFEFMIEIALLVGGWLLIKPDHSGRRWPRSRFVVALGVLEFAALAYGVNRRPWLSRCWSWPFHACDDSSWLTAKWKNRWTGAQPEYLPQRRPWRNRRS